MESLEEPENAGWSMTNVCQIMLKEAQQTMMKEVWYIYCAVQLRS